MLGPLSKGSSLYLKEKWLSGSVLGNEFVSASGQVGEVTVIGGPFTVTGYEGLTISNAG